MLSISVSMKDRFFFHKKFYIPSFLCLILSLPGMFSGDLVHRPLVYSFNAIVTVGFAFCYLVILLLPTTKWPKIYFSLILSFIALIAQFAWMRDQSLGGETVDFLTETTYIRAFIPSSCTALLLCFLDERKREETHLSSAALRFLLLSCQLCVRTISNKPEKSSMN